MNDIFISYSRQDQDIVLPFVTSIEQRFGSVCWIDLDGIESGSQFEDVIIDAIDACKVVLFMLSDNSLASKWTKREVLYAEKKNKRIVPIVIDGKGLRKWFEFHFCNIDYVDFKSQEQQEKLFKNLATWLGVKMKVANSCFQQNLQVQPASQSHKKMEISDDGKEIKIHLVADLYLTLMWNNREKYYVGELPVKKILIRMRVLALTAIGKNKIEGKLIDLMKEFKPDWGTYYTKITLIKAFYAIIMALNVNYGINLKKKFSVDSDFMVKLVLD